MQSKGASLDKLLKILGLKLIWCFWFFCSVLFSKDLDFLWCVLFLCSVRFPVEFGIEAKANKIIKIVYLIAKEDRNIHSLKFKLQRKRQILAWAKWNRELGHRQSYIYQVLQTIQMKLILLCVWAELAVSSSTKTALKFFIL